MNNTTDSLRDRVEARKHELLAKLSEIKADARSDAGEARTKVKQKLDELELYLKVGWDKLTDATRTKLDHWLKN